MARKLLAPVRNDRKSAEKTTAVSAGSVVSTHYRRVVGSGAVGVDLAQEPSEIVGTYLFAALLQTILYRPLEQSHSGGGRGGELER